MRWRASLLARITDAFELELLLERMCPSDDVHILDAVRGDGVLAVELSKRGANVTGVDASDATVFEVNE